MDIAGVRTFVAVTEHGQFQAAADDLSISQQAVSKRIATLERELGASLFARTPRGAQLTVDGQAFLPHARALLAAAARARDAVHPETRALRVDVLNRKTAPGTALRAFHRLRPELPLDVVALPDASLDAALAAVHSGSVDATFRLFAPPAHAPPAHAPPAHALPAHALPPGLLAARVIDDRHELLVGPRHRLAGAASLTLAELGTERIWMPGMRAGTEWHAYYAELSRVFGLRIDSVGPSFGDEALLEAVSESAELATLVGAGTRYLWPEASGLRRIPIVAPTPVYPHSIIWRADNRHPALAAFLDFLGGQAERAQPRDAAAPSETWAPSWASS